MSNSTFSISNVFNTKSDFLGAAASTLCMIHCLCTPLIFAAQITSLSCAEIAPTWWKMIDLIFLVIAFAATYFTARSTSSTWIPRALYGCWLVFAILILNGFFQLVPIPHSLIYVPALALICLHLYNKRYCQCNDEECCIAV